MSLSSDLKAYLVNGFIPFKVQIHLLSVNERWRQAVLRYTSHAVAFVRLFCRLGMFSNLKTLQRSHRVPIAWHAQNHVALRIASQYGRLNILQWLIDVIKLDPSVCHNYAFMMLCKHGHLDLVQYLWQDSRVRAEHEGLHRGLNMAARYGHLAIVRFLFAQPLINPAQRCQSAFREAAHHGHCCVVRFMLQDCRIHAAVMDNIVLKQACYDGCEPMVEVLLQEPRINPAGWPIITAAQRGHLSIVKRLLLDKRVRPSTHNCLAIRLAAEMGHEPVVRMFLADPRIKPGNWLKDALYKAQRKKHNSIFTLLLRWSDRGDLCTST